MGFKEGHDEGLRVRRGRPVRTQDEGVAGGADGGAVGPEGSADRGKRGAVL